MSDTRTAPGRSSRHDDAAQLADGGVVNPLAGGPKLYGALAGAPSQSSPLRPVDQAYANGVNVLMVRDKIQLAGAAAASQVSLGLVGWDTIIDPQASAIWRTALGAGVTFTVGDVTFPGALLGPVDASVVGAIGLISNLALTLVGFFQPLWQALGYADAATARLVGAKCELLATTAGAAATGTLAWQIHGAARI
jgi:hypothetical protein